MECLFPRLARQDMIALATQVQLDQLANVLFIVYHQDRRLCHSDLPNCRAGPNSLLTRTDSSPMIIRDHQTANTQVSPREEMPLLTTLRGPILTQL